ncbi:hypothetical protein AAG906_030515 [Vitis piasezkii]
MKYRGHSSDPDPLLTFVLVLQDRHRSHLVDSGQDVAITLGLRIHGFPITSTCDIDWSLLCYELLDDATLERLHVGRPDFGRPLAPPAVQHLDHDAADDLPIEGPIGVHHGLLDEDQGLQDETLLDEGLPVDLLGCRWKVPLSWAQNLSRVLTFYRDQLDAQAYDQVLWEPYMRDLVAHLPAISLAD